MQQVESDFQSFYEYCRQNGFTKDEMEEICLPFYKFSKNNSNKKRLVVMIAIVLVIASIYTISNVDTLQWHTSALVRITMIKILPFWDWSYLFYKRCLIDKNKQHYYDETELSPSDCNTCESIASIKRIQATTYDNIFNQHLIRGAPVIVTDAYAEWITFKSSDINITQILINDERFRDSIPCEFQSNLRINIYFSDFNAILNRIHETEISGWFLHFQNCELQGIKALRTIVPRPYFLSPHIPPAHFNWLLMSNKYMAPTFKLLELDPGLITLSQLKGSTLIQLTPRTPCEILCPTISFDVREGETLVLPNIMWNFEYIPNENATNIAILMETEWNEY